MDQPVEPQSTRGRNRQGLLYAGVGLGGLGLVAAAGAYWSNEQAKDARQRLEMVSEPHLPPELREQPLAEIDQKNRQTLALAVAAGVAGVTGVVMLLVAIAPKRSKRTTKLQWRSGWGAAANF